MCSIKRLSFTLCFALAMLSGCTSAIPLGFSIPGTKYKEPETIRGVVNGLWQFDPGKNAARLEGMFVDASEVEASQLANQHQVRVGINRSYFISSALEIVLLPKGWSYSPDEVIDNGQTINVGDVVDVRGQTETKLSTVSAIVRKCGAPPVTDENKDWNIGCRRVKGFNSRGYGGEKYYLSGF